MKYNTVKNTVYHFLTIIIIIIIYIILYYIYSVFIPGVQASALWALLQIDYIIMRTNRLF